MPKAPLPAPESLLKALPTDDGTVRAERKALAGLLAALADPKIDAHVYGKPAGYARRAAEAEVARCAKFIVARAAACKTAAG